MCHTLSLFFIGCVGDVTINVVGVRREERNVLDELLDNQEDDELDVELNKGFRVKTRSKFYVKNMCFVSFPCFLFYLYI